MDSQHKIRRQVLPAPTQSSGHKEALEMRHGQRCCSSDIRVFPSPIKGNWLEYAFIHIIKTENNFVLDKIVAVVNLRLMASHEN